MVASGSPGSALMSARRKPLKKPLIKPSKRGDLHRKLGVPEGQTIPSSKITAALHSGSPDLRRKANFARNFGGK